MKLVIVMKPEYQKAGMFFRRNTAEISVVNKLYKHESVGRFCRNEVRRKCNCQSLEEEKIPIY